MKESLFRNKYRYIFVLFVILLFISLTPIKQLSGFYGNENESENKTIENYLSTKSNLETNDFSPNKSNYSLLSLLNAGNGYAQTDLCIKNNLVYVAYNDLFIYDISNYSSPVLLTKFISLWGMIIELKVENNLAYMICKNQGLVILNVTDYTSISEVSICGYFDGEANQPKFLKSGIRDGCISGNIAYLVTSNSFWGGIGWATSSTLFLIDFTDPKNPKPIDYHEEEGRFQEVFVVGDRCYLQYEERTPAGGADCIRILDVSNPEKISSITRHRNNRLVSIYDDSKAIVFKDNDYWLVDFTKPRLPKFLSRLVMPEENTITNNCIYTFDTMSGNLSIINIQDGSNPVYYSQIILQNKVCSLHVSEDLLYLIGPKIQIFNISNFQAPSHVNEFPYCEEITNYFDMFIENDRLYLLDATSSIIIKNMTSLTNPKTIGQYFFEYNFNLSYYNKIEDVSFLVKNNCCYVVRNNYFEIINCTIPASPVIIYSETFNEPESFYFSSTILINESLMYLTSEKTLYIYNISNPQNPVILSELVLDSSQYLTYYTCSSINSNLLFLSDSGSTKIVDVSDPLNPVINAEIVTPLRPKDTLIHDNIFYVASYDFHIYNITNPSFPLEIAVLDEFSYYGSLFISNNYLYASNDQGITVYDIEDILNMRQIGNFTYDKIDWHFRPDSNYNDGEVYYSMQIANDNIYTLYSGFGLTIIGDDNDRDNIADYLEETVYNTNSTLADTDSDSMSDFYEVNFGLNPLDSNDKDIDYDFDDLSNFEESELLTNPFSKDTDHDNILDQNEILYLTDPTNWDTDLDGLSDGLEVFVVDLDPTLCDTDGDEIGDFHELVNYRFPPSGLFYLFLIPAIVIVCIVVLIVMIVFLSRIIKRRRLNK